MKHKKIIFGSVLSVAAIATPIVISTSCGKNKHINLLNKNKSDIDTLSHKMVEENIRKINADVEKEIPNNDPKNITWSPSTWTPKNASGDKDIIKLIEKEDFKDFFADQNFVKHSNGVFQRSPRTIISGSPQVSDVNNLFPMLFGMSKLEDFVKSHNGQIQVSLIPRTENDTTGTLGVNAKITINGKTANKEYIINGFTITKDIFMNGDKFTNVKSIIDALDSKTHMGFDKNVAIMTPQDLKNELIDLYNETYGGRLTIIGLYKGKISAIALDRHQMLKDLINSFGNVTKVKRYNGKWIELGFALVTSPGNVDTGSLLDLFSEYSKDLTDEKKNDVAGLLGNAPAKVMNMFPDLLKLFSQVSDGVKKMGMVNQWAIDNGKAGEVDKLNHILVRWVLASGKLQ